jgi:hypothetical protein
MVCVYLLLRFRNVYHHVKPMVLTIIVGYGVTRYCNSQKLYYKIDVITVYFLVWQFLYLIYQWIKLQLEWPFFIFHQASCCIFTCIVPLIFNEMVLRYFPFSINITLLWIVSLYDM